MDHVIERKVGTVSNYQEGVVISDLKRCRGMIDGPGSSEYIEDMNMDLKECENKEDILDQNEMGG